MKRKKQFINNRKHAKDNTITPGDRVIVTQPKQNKLTPNFQPQPFIITHIMTAQSEIYGTHITRNFKDIPNDPCFQYIKNEDDEEPDEKPTS